MPNTRESLKSIALPVYAVFIFYPQPVRVSTLQISSINSAALRGTLVSAGVHRCARDVCVIYQARLEIRSTLLAIFPNKPVLVGTATSTCRASRRMCSARGAQPTAADAPDRRR